MFYYSDPESNAFEIDLKCDDGIKQKYYKLGNLDSILNPLQKITKVRNIDSNKISAILLETNVVELQRHLLKLCVQNQVKNIIVLCSFNHFLISRQFFTIYIKLQNLNYLYLESWKSLSN